MATRYTIVSNAGPGAISQTVNLPSGSSITYTVTMRSQPAAPATSSTPPPLPLPTASPTRLPPTTPPPIPTPRQAAPISRSPRPTGPPRYTPGGNAVYTVVVNNAGPSNVTGATVTDALPTGISSSWTAVASGGATRTLSGSGAISQTINLPPGSSITYTVTMAVPAGRTGDLVNTATVTPPTASPTRLRRITPLPISTLRQAAPISHHED